MKTEENKNTAGLSGQETGNDTSAQNNYAPRAMSFRENVVLTIKVLTGFGLLGAALWGVELWTLAR